MRIEVGRALHFCPSRAVGDGQECPGISTASEPNAATLTRTVEPQVIGNPNFIHLEKDNGVWWLRRPGFWGPRESLN